MGQGTFSSSPCLLPYFLEARTLGGSVEPSTKDPEVQVSGPPETEHLWPVASPQILDPPNSCHPSGSFSRGVQLALSTPAKSCWRRSDPRRRAGGLVGELGLCHQTWGCGRASDVSAADVWRSIRDNGFGWTQRSMAKIFLVMIVFTSLAAFFFSFLRVGWHSVAL